MGGNSETGAGVADCSIGSIVWVRRRNGSWWPGKILGPDELSASHVMSPRSGTPVKLLGREDASVDWYNLEKSKRVKAFRCGEFDDCIEKAEASQGMPPKKREKYARREDAILHALELERQILEKKREKVGYSSKGESSVSPYGAKKASLISLQYLETGNGKHSQTETQYVCESLCLPLKDKGEDQDMHAERVKEENPLSVDDDNYGVPPRTRGLQDFGLRTVPLNFKTSPVASPNGSHKPSFDNSVQTHSNNGLAAENMVDATLENSADKRKRSHEGSGEDSLAKRRERRRPLLQVLENSSQVLVPHSQADDGIANLTPMSEDEQPGIVFPVKRSRYTCLQPVDLDEEKNMGSTEDTETDSSETDSLDSDTDELASLSEGAASIELQPKYPRRSEAWAEDKSLSSEELDELALSDEISKPCSNGPASASMGVSRWQLKGKRNNRSLLKRPVDGTDRNLSWGSIDETMTLEMGTNGQDETYSVGKNFMPQMAGYGSRGSDGISRRTVQWQHWDWSDHRVKGYWEDSGKYFDPVYVGRLHTGGRSMLVDVDLKVQSRYQREHVPMISLMSKINGQAIVGHPIPIEVLENGSSESFLLETDEWNSEIVENETAIPPMWRTARRTANFRVPRPDLSSTCDESAKNLQSVDSRRGHAENPDAGAVDHKGGIMEKHTTHVPVDRKSSRKPLKKISLSSNQKIRTLSSIASQQKPSTDSRQCGNNSQADGLKPVSVSRAVACIPVKLVFSRLQEELVGRHS